MTGRRGHRVYSIPTREKTLLAVGFVEGRRISFRAYLYFPDCHEGNTYAVSSIRMGSACPEFENAQNRVFTTEHGKLLQLYGERIRLKSGRDKILLEAP